MEISGPTKSEIMFSVLILARRVKKHVEMRNLTLSFKLRKTDLAIIKITFKAFYKRFKREKRSKSKTATF